MNQTQLFDEALKLDPQSRMDLAMDLLETIDPPPGKPITAEELNRRIVEIRSGAVEAIPWEEARKRIFGNG
ncbi:addiction module protein [Lacunimicrobium album]